MQMWTCPTHARPTARDCRIFVRPDMIQQLRGQIGGEEARQNAYQFVSPEFQAMADAAFTDLGSPNPTLTTAWSIFSAMVNALHTYNQA